MKLEYDKRITNAFIRFLRERNITRRYKYNCIKYRSGRKYNTCVKFIRSAESIQDKNYLLSYAFHWTNTKEGNAFWLNIYEKWNMTWNALWK